ncbi:MAG: cysteine hydrolase [Oscillospiraceae bacterium]|nr:cysteine hydrolase [Oscillospiraceae bacterium]
MKKILVVVDMQNDFIDGALGTAEAQAIVDVTAEKIRSFDGIVITTQDTHYENYSETMEGRKLPVKHCIEGEQGWKLNDKIAAAVSEKAETYNISKHTFGSMELVEAVRRYMHRYEIESIELVGLCTDICVVSNAMLLRAAFPNMILNVDAGCCAGVTPETHKAALVTMKQCQIDVTGE